MGFEPTISAGERSQTYALDRAANGSGTVDVSGPINTKIKLASYLTWPYTIDRIFFPILFQHPAKPIHSSLNQHVPPKRRNISPRQKPTRIPPYA